MKRRDLLKGGMAAGAILATPIRALAAPLGDSLTNAFDTTFAPPATTFARPSPSTGYQKRLADIAKRELGRAGSKIWRSDIVGIADFALPSSDPRLHFVNLENGTVRSFLVAHGKGSDLEHDGWLKQFSNGFGSEATSRGAFLTCEWYNGKYGTSIRMVGLDADNSNALERAIVMHPAAYVDPSMIEKFGKIGRSFGCFAMAPTDFSEALWHLSGGRLVFADRIGAA